MAASLNTRESTLFAESVAKITETGNRNWTRNDVCCFILDRNCLSFNEETTREEIRSLFRFYSPEFSAARMAVIRLLERSPFEQVLQQSRWSSSITRATDFGRSYAKSLTSAPLQYYQCERNRVPHELVGSYLVALATRLEKIEQISTQGEPTETSELSSAIENGRRRYGVQYSSRIGKRKEVLDYLFQFSDCRSDVKAILAYENLLSGLFEVSKFDDFVKVLGETLQAANSDALLETIFQLQVVQLAQESGFQLVTEPSALRGNKNNSDTWELHQDDGDLKLIISKGKAKAGADSSNSLYQNCRTMMGDGSSGFEPDLRMKFINEQADSTHVFIGDSKRNAAGNGNTYRGVAIKASLAYYADMENELTTNPQITLLFAQRGPAVAGETDSTAIVDKLGTGGEALPKILGLGIKDFENTAEVGRAWFTGILARVQNAAQ